MNGHPHFGNLFKMKNIITIRLSPFEQSVMWDCINPGIPNMLRRIKEEILYVVPPLMLGYGVHELAEYLHDKKMRKNPADYENDEPLDEVVEEEEELASALSESKSKCKKK